MLGPEAFGALSRAPVAVMPLGGLQRLAGLPGRVTRILVQAGPGAKRRCARSCGALARRAAAVAPADQDVALLEQALGPSDQASALFAAISALLGFLLAFNALLLTVPERRQAIAELRDAGARRTAIVQMVAFQALCLGLAASLVGLGAAMCSRAGSFTSSTGYLAEAFTLGRRHRRQRARLLLSFSAACSPPAWPRPYRCWTCVAARALDAVYAEGGVPGDALGQGMRTAAVAGGRCACWRGAERAVRAGALGGDRSRARCWRSRPSGGAARVRGRAGTAELLARALAAAAILPMALSSLRATTLRSLALAATGAVALFGSVALGGSRDEPAARHPLVRAQLRRRRRHLGVKPRR